MYVKSPTLCHFLAGQYSILTYSVQSVLYIVEQSEDDDGICEISNMILPTLEYLAGCLKLAFSSRVVING